MKSPFLTIWPSANPTVSSLPAIWVRMVTVSKGVTVPSALIVIGISPSVTGAIRTVCGGGPERPALPSVVEGAIFSIFCQANTAATARATTRAIRVVRLRRWRGAGCLGGVSGVGATGAVGAARPATSGLTASFIQKLTRLSRMTREDAVDKSTPRVLAAPAIVLCAVRSTNRGVAIYGGLGDKGRAKRRRRLTDAGVAQG